MQQVYDNLYVDYRIEFNEGHMKKFLAIAIYASIFCLSLNTLYSTKFSLPVRDIMSE